MSIDLPADPALDTVPGRPFDPVADARERPRWNPGRHRRLVEER